MSDQPNPPLNATGFTVSVTHFYGWIIGAILIVLGAGSTMFAVMESRVSSLDGNVKSLLESNSRMEGRLESLLPLLDRAMLERASVEPSLFGIDAIEDANLQAIPAGWSVVNRDAIMALETTGKLTLSGDWMDSASPYLFVDCNSEMGAGSQVVSCKPLNWRSSNFESSDAKELLNQFELPQISDE